MPAGEPEDPLCQQVLQRVPDLAGVPLVHEASREAVDQSLRSLGRLQQDGGAVGTRVLLIEGGNERATEKIRKENSLWYRLGRQRKRLRRGESSVATAFYHAETFVSLPKSAPS
jgi:hypothetical protein